MKHGVAARRLSADQARRAALGAQGLSRAKPVGRIDRRHLRRVLDDIGLIQIDSVNVLVRSQELPLFARLGAHPRSLIDDATAAGDLFEYWVHEASHVPVKHHHLYRWSMRYPHKWSALRAMAEERPNYLDDVYRHVAENGPITAGDLKQRVGKKGTWWDWDDGKVALEALFFEGRLSARRRRSDFARVYDITERVIDAKVLAIPEVPEHEARKALLVLAARHHGVGTLDDLSDYHRQGLTACRTPIAELVEEGRLIAVEVAGWEQPAFMHPDTVIPRAVEARALLSPFDPVVWRRQRAQRMFGFHYRIEIYTPKPKRRYGYYVLPFLLGDQIVGRVDLKADRAAGVLRAQASWIEPAHEARAALVADELWSELRAMAAWLELDRVEATDRGNLSGPLLQVARAAP